jgi:hypothetical protein
MNKAKKNIAQKKRKKQTKGRNIYKAPDDKLRLGSTIKKRK